MTYLFPGQNEQESSCPRNKLWLRKGCYSRTCSSREWYQGWQASTCGQNKMSIWISTPFWILKLWCSIQFFEARPKSRPSLFDRECDEINKAFNKQWHPTKACQLYCGMFTIRKWKKLSTRMKQKHSLSKCRQCASEHLSLQESFPIGPVYHTEPIVSFPPNSTFERKVMRLAMKELHENCMEHFGSSLPDLVAKHTAKMVSFKRASQKSGRKLTKEVWTTKCMTV